VARLARRRSSAGRRGRQDILWDQHGHTSPPPRWDINNTANQSPEHAHALSDTNKGIWAAAASLNQAGRPRVPGCQDSGE
jgi:hypothetical protein